jgi:hypothetical protein
MTTSFPHYATPYHPHITLEPTITGGGAAPPGLPAIDDEAAEDGFLLVIAHD